MKTALLHYWLTNIRGGEKVLAALAEMYPAADIFTHAYVKEKMDLVFGSHRVTESFIAALPFGRRMPQAYLPLMPLANRRFDLAAYDLILSSESGPIKGITKRRDQRHICYCHTPMRYVWDMYEDYYASAGIGGKLAMKLWTPYMRYEDRKSAESVDQFVANSHFVAERIKRIYDRDAVVVYPPVNVEFFGAARPPYQDEPYYLFAGAPVKYKRLDLAVAACAKMGRKLVIAGGKDHPVTNEALRRLYGGAKALIFPGIEDFGIVSVEAQAAGTPVIAFGKGGALETVVDGRTGLFFHEQTVEGLCGAIEAFESRSFNAADCRANAARFTVLRFKTEMQKLVTANNGE